MPGNLDDVAWPVTMPRLTLRRARPDDADIVLSYRSLPSLVEWMGEPPPDFHERFTAPERLDLLLMVERDGVVVGEVMVRVGDAWAPATLVPDARGVQAELGWALRPEETGKGYATEAVEAALRLCFDQLGLRRVVASCFVANTASWRLMERVGMRREAHTLEGALHPSGAWLDGYGYALLADEWRSRHS